jgi:hypothetical protein
MSTRSGRRGWMLAVGVVVLVGLLGTSLALMLAAGERRSDNVAGFARAPVGCDTTLDFEATGRFVLYVETTGEFGQLAGECDAPLRYDRVPNDVIEPSLVLLDATGTELTLDESDPDDYDVDGYVGSSLRTVEISTPGDHLLTVASVDGEPFAVAVGRSVDDGVALLRWGAIAAAIAGLLLGGFFLVMGSRRPPAPDPVPAPWTPDEASWPSSPPGFPIPPPTTGATGPARAPTGKPSAPAWGPPSSPHTDR